MIEPRQKIMLDLGEGGCYWLCFIRITESLFSNRRIDAVEKFLEAIKLGLCKEDGFINDPEGIMEFLYGGNWEYHKEDADYRLKPGEFEILRYENPTPKMIYSHFVLGNGNGGIEYDPLGKSNTVTNGKLVSKRILKLVIGLGG